MTTLTAYIDDIVDLGLIRPGPYQNRQNFSALDQLAITIRDHGLAQPLLVDRANEYGYFPLIAGERRWRALGALALADRQIMTFSTAIETVSGPDGRLKLVNLAKHLEGTQVAVRFPANGAKARILAIIENGQREPLNLIEEGLDYQALLDDGYNLVDLPDLTGKSLNVINKALKWLQLEPEIRDMVAAGRIPGGIGVARALLSITDVQDRLGLARRAAARRLTAEQIAAACAGYAGYNKDSRSRRKASSPSPGTPVPALPLPGSERPAGKVAVLPASTRPATAYIPLAQVQKVAVYQPPAKPAPLSLEAADWLLALAEEACGTCVDHFSRKCLECPAFISFANRLIRAVREVSGEPPR